MVLLKQFIEPITEAEYRASERCSYSFLKDLSERDNLAILSPKEAFESKGLTLGSIVDKMCSDSSYVVSDEYTICDIELDLSGTTNPSKIVKQLFDNGIIVERDDMETILLASTECGVKRNPDFNEAFWQQVELSNMKIMGSKIVSSAEVELAYKMFDVLNTHEWTKDIFNPGLDIEVLNQAPIFFEVNGVECKALVDKILVDHKAKVIQPYDIKTGAERDFLANFYKYKYYYQGSHYTIGLSKVCMRHPELQGYTINPFRFIYLSRADSNTPIQFEMDAEFVSMANAGWRSASGYNYKGLRDLREDYKWYMVNGAQVPRVLAENNGIIKLDTPLVLSTDGLIK